MTDTFNMEDWLAGVEMPAEGVTIYQKPGLIAQLVKAREAYEAVKDLPSETTMGEVSPKARLQALQRQVERSKTVWYISPLTREEDQEVEEMYPEPEAPPYFDVPPPRMADRATVEQAVAFQEAYGAWKIEHGQWEKAHAKELDAYQTALEACAVNRGCERLSRAVTYIETYDEKGIGTIVPAHLKPKDIQAAERRLGKAQMGLLAEALYRVSTEPPADPDPFE